MDVVCGSSSRGVVVVGGEEIEIVRALAATASVAFLAGCVTVVAP